MTTVISLYGGSGLGKSTTAALLFGELKLRGHNAELVQEYVKKWAHQGKPVTPLDQTFILGKQMSYESCLYNKVDYVITDSPIFIPCIYQSFYLNKAPSLEAAKDFYYESEKMDVKHLNFILSRHKEFDPRGRYETAETAKEVDKHVVEKLEQWGIPFIPITSDDRQRVQDILNMVVET